MNMSNYGNATPEDLLRPLTAGRGKTVRYWQSAPGKVPPTGQRPDNLPYPIRRPEFLQNVLPERLANVVVKIVQVVVSSSGKMSKCCIIVMRSR